MSVDFPYLISLNITRLIKCRNFSYQPMGGGDRETTQSWYLLAMIRSQNMGEDSDI
jgi:hypothetical protein